MTTTRKRRLLARLLAVLLAGALVAAACGNDDDDTSTAPAEEDATEEPAAEEEATEEPAVEEEATEEPAVEEEATEEAMEEEESAIGEDGLPVIGSAERCEANQAAGTLIFQTGFDYAASAGILEIIAAEAEGYFDEMCLDVEVQAGLSPQNSASLAAGTTQLAVIASFGELVRQNVNGETDLMAFAQLGHTAIAELVVPADGEVQELTDLEGKTVGIKGDLPTSVEAMMAAAGLERGTFEELLLDGFDPVAHLDLGIDALPVFRSNEPAILDREGVEYIVFDPLDYDVPSSFAVYISSRENYEQWPTAIEDFVRAGLRGYEFAAENPEAAVGHAFELINAAGNQFFLAEDHELSRWTTEQATIEEVTPEGLNIGGLNVPRLGEEVQLQTDLGVFDEVPDWESMLDASVVPKLYDDGGALIWIPMN